MQHLLLPRNVRGLHGSPYTNHIGDLHQRAHALAELDISCVKIMDDGSGSALQFAETLREHDIVPFVRIWRNQPNPGRLDARALNTIKTYIQRQITPWFEVNNEPNLPYEWKPGEWQTGGRPELVVQNWLIDAAAVIDLGGYPAFPALAQCRNHGECSSLRWYDLAFQYLAEHADKAKPIFENGAWMAVHDAALNHFTVIDGEWRFDYPYFVNEMPNTEKKERSILTDDNSLIGHQVPMYLLWKYFELTVPCASTEGGVFFDEGAQWDNRFPPITELLHRDATLKMFEWLTGYRARNPWYIAMMPWLAADTVWGGAPSIWAKECWWQRNRTLMIVDALKTWKQDPQPPLPEGKYGLQISSAEDPGGGGNGGSGNGNGNGEEMDIEYVGLSQEMIDRLTISPAEDPSKPHWKIVRVEVQPETRNQSAFVVMPKTFTNHVMFGYGAGEEDLAFVEPKADMYAPAGAREWAASLPMFSAWGGDYSASMTEPSELIKGFGLYGDNLELTHTSHHPVLIYFEWVEGDGEQPPPPKPAEFPRPHGDNGMGIHFSVDDISEALVTQQIVWAKAMHMTWANVACSSRELMVRAAAQVWAAGIMPITRWIGNIVMTHDFAADARALIAAKVPPYVQIFNEPSDNREWEGDERPDDYIAKWARRWAVKASEVARVGGFPGLQCLHPEELQAVFDYLSPDDPTWKRVWFCSHNYGVNHPPSWHEDEWCVLGFEDFVDIFQQRLGFVPPIICGEGGWLYGADKDNRYPRVGDELHAAYHKEMFGWFKEGKLSDGKPLPDYLFAVCPWILTGSGSEPWYGSTVKTQTIEAVKSLGAFTRKRPWAKGLDVSSYQKTIDWEKAAKGHDFVFIRASAGLTKDVYYDRNEVEAEKQGLLRGAYHFLRADMDAAAQARFFAGIIASSGLEIVPRLDVEWWESGSPTQAMVEAFVEAFAQALACYTSVWQWDQNLHLEGNCGMSLLWVADHTHKDAPWLPSAWKDWEFWQHTSVGKVDGIQRNVDLDYFHGTTEDLKARYGVDQAIKTIMPLANEQIAGIPSPPDHALAAKAIEVGFPIQIRPEERTTIDGVKYAYQVFTRAAQDKYIVCYCKVGDWQKVRWSEIVRS